MNKVNLIVFLIKTLLTIGITIIFNQFLTKNFEVTLPILVVSSFITSVVSYSFLTKEYEILTEVKDIFKK